jgi:asparagine synthase (glutamine-hydrolysing)
MRLNGGQGKWLMTQVMAPFLPAELLRRPEAARAAAPDVRVPADAAALARSPLLGDTGWFDMEVLGKLVADERAGHGCTLRLLVMLERSLHRLFDASA